MNEILFEMVKLAVMLIAAAVGLYVLPYLRNRSRGAKLKRLAFWAEKLVLKAEQVMKEESGIKKKMYVTDMLKEIAAEVGILISGEQLDALIEAAVKSMKMGGGNGNRKADT